MLNCILQFKGEPKKVEIKIVELIFLLLAHKGSGFDSYVVLYNLPRWRSVVNSIENGTEIVSLNKFNGYVDQVKKYSQYVHARCGLLHIDDSLEKIGKKGKTFKLQSCSLKQELQHDEIYEDHWEEKEEEW